MNRLLSDDSHKISDVIVAEDKNTLQNVLSAAVVMNALIIKTNIYSQQLSIPR